MDTKDRIALLAKQYEEECRDNSELYRRGGLVLTAQVVVGSALFALLKVAGPCFSITEKAQLCGALQLAAGITVLLLVATVALLFASVWPRSWDYPDLDLIESGDAEKVLSSFKMSSENARARNIWRFTKLSWSFAILVICVVFLGVSAVCVLLMV